MTPGLETNYTLDLREGLEKNPLNNPLCVDKGGGGLKLDYLMWILLITKKRNDKPRGGGRTYLVVFSLYVAILKEKKFENIIK